MKIEKLPEVAKNVYYPCTKCDRERYFRVLAHVSEKEAKIECEVCGAKKKLKVGVAAKKKATRTRKKANPWIDLKEKNKDKVPEGYTIKGQFSEEAVIEHPMFGLGFVTASMNQKIEVIFEEGPKTLMHKRD